MYFKQIPNILYDFIFKNQQKVVVVKDITVNVRFLKETLENITVYDEYDIVDGETPEIISEKIYGSPHYHWAIMISNLKFDYIADFPLTYDRLGQFVKDKYGDDNSYSIHHYEDSNGFIVNSDYAMALPVTNFAYEELINESKRRIKLISKDILQQLINEFNSIV